MYALKLYMWWILKHAYDLKPGVPAKLLHGFGSIIPVFCKDLDLYIEPGLSGVYHEFKRIVTKKQTNKQTKNSQSVPIPEVALESDWVSLVITAR